MIQIFILVLVALLFGSVKPNPNDSDATIPNADFSQKNGGLGDKDTLLGKAQFLLMRHAESMTNIQSKELMKKESYHRRFVDAQLSPHGVIQATDQQQLLNQIVLNPIVLVSPQRRAIQTAVNVLATHPQKATITIRLEPLLKECTHSAGTVPVSAFELAQFVKKTSAESGIKIEFADKMLEKDNWNLDVLTDQKYVQALKAEMQTNNIDFLDAIVKLKSAGHFKKGEDDKAMYDRSRKVRKYLIDHAVKHRFDNRKTLVVSHGVTLAFTLISGKFKEDFCREKYVRHLQYFKNTMIEPLFVDLKKDRKFYWTKDFNTYVNKNAKTEL